MVEFRIQTVNLRHVIELMTVSDKRKAALSPQLQKNSRALQNVHQHLQNLTEDFKPNGE